MTRKYYQANKEKVLAASKEYRLKHREAYLARMKRYYQQHKEEKTAKHRLWREQHPEYGKMYRAKNADRISDRNKKYWVENKPLVQARNKKNYEKHRPDRLAKAEEYRKAHPFLKVSTFERQQLNLQTWVGVVPKYTQCQCCGKDIIFASGDTQRSIHFDHRHGGGELIEKPMAWLRSHKRTSESETVWKSCDFGMLCIRCNNSIPTENRTQYAKNLLNYVGGV